MGNGRKIEALSKDKIVDAIEATLSEYHGHILDEFVIDVILSNLDHVLFNEEEE